MEICNFSLGKETMTHELKCAPIFWPYYKNGFKNNSMRKNDRRFAVGDIVILRLWENDHYVTGEVVVRKITHIVHDFEFKELKPGYCLLSLSEV